MKQVNEYQSLFNLINLKSFSCFLPLFFYSCGSASIVCECDFSSYSCRGELKCLPNSPFFVFDIISCSPLNRLFISFLFVSIELKSWQYASLIYLTLLFPPHNFITYCIYLFIYLLSSFTISSSLVAPHMFLYSKLRG